MKLALSTNWCNRRIASGREQAERARELGFDALELGFCTTAEQAREIVAADVLPVGSVHAFCPVPLSAPYGHPELYALASADAEAVRMAELQVRRNVAFAAEVGADTVVLHAGRVSCAGWFPSRAARRRRVRGARVLDAFRATLARIVPDLEKAGVTLALENLPYREGFPDEAELLDLLANTFAGAPVRGWFDTGHDRIRTLNGWTDAAAAAALRAEPARFFAGMHLNDVVDVHDDHFAPGDGKVDFAALAGFARAVGHVVFEPAESVSDEALARGLAHIRALWRDDEAASGETS